MQQPILGKHTTIPARAITDSPIEMSGAALGAFILARSLATMSGIKSMSPRRKSFQTNKLNTDILHHALYSVITGYEAINHTLNNTKFNVC